MHTTVRTVTDGPTHKRFKHRQQMNTKTTFQARTVGLLVTVMFAAVLFLSGCGSGAESQEFSAFLSRPLAEVSLGELLFCMFCVCLITR